MDDPTLAPSLSATALDASGAAALTFRVLVPEGGNETSFDRAAPVAALPATSCGTPDAWADPAFDLDPREAAAFLDDPGDLRVAPARASGAGDEVRSPSSRPARDLLVVATTAAAGATAGYHGALRGWVGPIVGISGGAPVDPILIGGLLGLLVGWGAVRWMTRRP
jgi:hypothetical protein